MSAASMSAAAISRASSGVILRSPLPAQNSRTRTDVGASGLCVDIPADFHEEWEDGRRYGERAAASKCVELLRLGYESGVYTGAKAATR